MLLAVIVAAGLATDAWAQASGVRRGSASTPTRTLPPSTPTRTPTPTPTTAPTLPPLADAFRLRYAANLNVGDSVVNLTNAGTVEGTDPAGNICANVYVFDPDESMVACCACRVTPNALVSLSARNDLISNTLTPAVPNSIVIKLVATTPPCNAALPTALNLAPGLRAWGTTLHALPVAGAYGLTETEFSPAVLSASELSQLASTCESIQTNGAGFGICSSCRAGGQ
jgi:hypothetical protein